MKIMKQEKPSISDFPKIPIYQIMRESQKKMDSFIFYCYIFEQPISAQY